jgi:methylmalonyl-CoA mutase
MGSGSNIVECAADVLRLLGHNMPQVGLSKVAE